MIRLALVGRSMDQGSRIDLLVDPGLTLGELMAKHRHPEWKTDQELYFLVGRHKREADYVPVDGAVVAIAPHIGEAFTIATTVIALLGTMYTFHRSKLALRAQKEAAELRKFRPYGFDTPSLTSYGEGFRIPIGYGEYRTGGHVIGSRLEQSNLVRLGTEASLLICLGEGEIESVGGLRLLPRGERDYMTTATYSNNGIPDPRFPYNSWEFPAGLRINGIDADGKMISCSIRLGTDSQSPIPDWPGAESNVAVSGTNLTAAGQSTSYTMTEADVFSVHAELFFPEGLWWEGNGGAINRRRVEFDLDYRIGTGAWVTRTVSYEADPPVLNPFSLFVDFSVRPAGGGPFEVRVVRQNASLDSGGRAHSAFSLKSVQIRYGDAFSYPNLALMSLRMPATEQLDGSLTNVSVPIRARKVRGWINVANGWTARTWGPVAPWTFPLSSNPAWAFVDLCLDKRFGFGHLIREQDLDLEAFRDWADLCDQPHPLDNDEPLLRFDGQFDAGEDAIEAFVDMMAAGRAIPVLSGGRKIGVKFSYRDSFSRGSGGTLNTVPVRTVIDVITTSNSRDFEITYTDPSTAPIVIDAQILDRDADYEFRLVSQEDLLAEAVVNGQDPTAVAPRRDSIRSLGVTRKIQARYEIQLQHNFNRLSKSAAKVRVPIEGMQLELGDLVLLQNVSLLAGGAEVKSWLTQSARTTNEGTGISSITLDRPISLDMPNPKTDMGVWIVDETSTTVRTFTPNLTSPTQVPAGTSIALWDPGTVAPAVLDLQRGSSVIVGLLGITNRAYEVVGISTTQDLQREVELVHWTTAIFDMPSTLDVTAGMGGDDPLVVDEISPTVHVEVQGQVATGEGMRTTTSLSWSPLAHALSRRARVYARTRDGRYSMLGESDTDRLEGLHLHAGAEYELHVCRANRLGVMPMPGQVTPVSITVPEFGAAAPAVSERITALVDVDKVILEWAAVDDALVYEVRRGEEWYGAEVLTTTPDTLHLIYCPTAGTSKYLVKSRGASGLYSDAAVTASVAWQPMTTIETATHLTTTVAGGTAVNVEWDGTAEAATISATFYRGTWTSPELTVEKDTFAYWSAGATVWAVDGGSLGSFTLGAPERFFETAGGRQSTRLYPGHDFGAGAAGAVEEYADPEMEQAYLGEWVRVLIETRFYVDGAWTAYAKHTPGRRLAERMQAKITLDRYALDIDVYVKTLVMTAGF